MGLIGVSVGILLAALAYYFVWPWYVRRVVHEVVEWLSRCGNFGTKNIQHGKAENVAEAKALKETYDEWRNAIVAGTTWYCHDSDANRFRFLDNWTGPVIQDTFPSARDGHTRTMAVEMVARIRDLAKRLDQGETTLRRVSRPPARVRLCSLGAVDDVLHGAERDLGHILPASLPTQALGHEHSIAGVITWLIG
jgi:hypothetical protein